jgi:hypothetical protein
MAYNKKSRHISLTFLSYSAAEVSVKRSVSRQLISTHSPTDIAAEGIITCAICQAVYAPSRLHAYLLQSPPIALESAFMSMCHFCFRCRRPSCPNCWDTAHSVCGQCAQETHVPFRVEIPPLQGTSYSSLHARFSTNDHSTPPSLVRVQPRRFQETPPSFNTPSPTQPNSYHPSNLQPPFPVRSAGTVAASSPVDIDKIATRPDRHTSPDIDSIPTRPNKSRTVNSDDVTTHPPLTTTRKTKPLRLFLTLFLLLAFLIVLVIGASLLLTNVNMLVYEVLHIDIRTELTSLWSFLRSLF